MIIDHPWYVVLLCLTAGAAYAAALYAFGRRPFARWLAWLLSALRFTAVSAIAFLLLAPVSRQTVHERQKPHVVVAVDRSLSVTGGADSTVSLAALCADLQANCQLTIDTFGNSSYTDIGEAISWSVLPVHVKWILCLLMLMGRLEIMTVLVLFTRDFWKDN